MARRKSNPILSPITEVEKARRIGSKAAKKGEKDRLTRVMSPIRGVITQGKQWNRWSV